MPTKRLILIPAAVALTVPVLAQESAPPAATAQNQPVTVEQPAAEQPTAAQPTVTRGADQQVVESSTLEDEDGRQVEMPPLIELPADARRDPFVVGRLDPVRLGLTATPWGGASGQFLSPLLRRMETPLASRWVHIGLRNALLARARAPVGINPVDWTAERAWLLLRLGEADAARMLVLGVDVDKFTPKMFQVAVQAFLASADPAGLCPLEQGIGRAEPKIFPAVQAMCAGLAGEPESAAAQIDTVRRRGQLAGIDLVLSEKVVGAGSESGRAVTVEWEPVDRLNAWRFGLATATGMTLPERLTDRAPPRLRAWQARAPLLAPADRLESAAIAGGLGVFSSQALIDLHSLVYESTDPDELPQTDGWRLRQAFIGRGRDTRLDAMRQIWRGADGSLEQEAARALVGRAAAQIVPDAELQADAPDLIASMLAAGFDRQAARWGGAVGQMDDQNADRAWAMLALGAPNTSSIDISAGRINSFIGRDNSAGKQRSALLVAGLLALNRVDASTANRLNSRHGLRLARQTSWSRMIDAAATRNQAGTVMALTGTGFQAPSFSQLPAAHLFRSVAALRRTGQEFLARMVAAEALART